MKEYFTLHAHGNCKLRDFIKCLQRAADQLGKDDLDVQSWVDTWLTKSGVNEINANFKGINENGQGKIIVNQSYPVIGD